MPWPLQALRDMGVRYDEIVFGKLEADGYVGRRTGDAHVDMEKEVLLIFWSSFVVTLQQCTRPSRRTPQSPVLQHCPGCIQLNANKNVKAL